MYTSLSTFLSCAILLIGCATPQAQRRPASIPTYGVMAHDVSNPFGKVHDPSPGEVKIYGAYSGGCVTGASKLPASGPGFEVAHLERNRMYGHPQLLSLLTRAGQQLGMKDHLIIGDLGQPLGGPMPTGHASHQIGLDADIWFSSTQENLNSMVKKDLISLNEAVWKENYAQQLLWFSAQPEVARIFVNAVIKRRLCAQFPGDERLKKLRPWWGHDDHFHVRLNCPADQPQCVPQEPADGIECDDKLDWWTSAEALDKIRHPTPTVPTPVMLPEECRNAVLR